MASQFYTLTATAEQDLRDAKAWSLSRWSKELTQQYFEDLHKGAEFVAQNYASLRCRDELAGGTGLSLYPVREHYLVYLPVKTDHIILVAFIRQVRDVPTILAQEHFRLNREVDEILEKIKNGDIKL